MLSSLIDLRGIITADALTDGVRSI